MTTDSGRVVAGDGGTASRRRGKAEADPFADLWEKANREADEAERAVARSEEPADEDGRRSGPEDRTTTVERRDVRERAPVPDDRVEDEEAYDEVDEVDEERSEKPAGGRAPRLRRERDTVPIKARQVHRLIRRVDPWSVLKVSFLFYMSVWLIGLLAGVILWQAAASTDVIDNIETFIRELFGLEVFRFNGTQIFRASLIGGLVAVVFGSAFTSLLAILFNLIADLTGGVRLTVLEVARARPVPDAGPENGD